MHYDGSYTWNGDVCWRCGTRYVGSHICYWPVVPTTTTYIPTVVTDPRINELLEEVKKLRRELKKARKDDSA